MASPSSTAAYDSTTAGPTGGGGKFRKKPLRKPHATPYDRPPTAIRPNHSINGNGNGNGDGDDNGWLAKIVTPASKLITFGAHKIFSSVFRKRLLPPTFPSSPTLGEGNEMEYTEHEPATTAVDSATKLAVDCGGNDHSEPSYSNGVAELEDVLKQKTFTRSEIDQLTALMLSRTSEDSDRAEKRNSEPKLLDRAIHAQSDKLSNLAAHENHDEGVPRGDISTPKMRSKVLPGDVASPAEIAKAYMANRSTKVSPSVLCLQNQLPKEHLSTPCSPSAKLISPAMYLTQKPVSDIGTSSHGFLTPRYQGRSEIYRTARTPYSRVHTVTACKAAETNLSIGGRSSYHNVTENNHYMKQAPKRRSSVLENDIGSVGPIRRIRHKANFLHPKTLALPPANGRQATHVSSMFSDVTDVRSSVECSSQNRSLSKVLAVNDSSGSSGRYVPSQSIKMAQKIFEQLDKFSPQGNLNKKPDVSAGTSPSKKPDMENVDSLKRSLSRHDTEKLKGSLDFVHEHNHPTDTSSMVKEDYPPMDGDVPSNVVAEGRHHAESPRKSIAIPDILQRDQTISVKRPLETKSAAQLRNPELENVANGCSGFETSVSLPSAIMSSSPFDMTSPNANSTLQPTPQSDKVTPQLEKSNIFTAVSSKSENLSPFIWTPPSVAKNTKVESPVSTNNTATEAVPDTPVKSTSLFGNAVIKSGDNPFVDAFPNGPQTSNTPLRSGVLSTSPATSASNTTDSSCQKSDTKSTTLASGGNGIFSFPASTVKSVGGHRQTDGPAASNKRVFPFQRDSTPASVSAPVSTSLPSFSGQSASSSTSVFGQSKVPIFGSDASSPLSSGPASTSSGLGSSFTPSSVFTGSSTTSSIFGFTSQSPTSTTLGLSGSAALTAGPIFGSSLGNHFSSKPTTASSSLASTSSSITPSIFGFTAQSTTPSTTTAPAPPSPTFSFGPESTKAPTTSSFIFGETNNSFSASNSSAPLVFGGNSGLAASTPAASISQFQSQPLFSNANSQPSVFASTPSTNADQMTVEEPMTQDSPQPAPPAFPAFGVPPSATSGGFVFNAAPTTGSVFQFNTQQSPVAPPPFQPSGSLEFNGGTSGFSLGTSDKSQRRIIKVKKGARRK
ncbi:hypothetical protein vseg_000369 [Gypsophila vaccaria]